MAMFTEEKVRAAFREALERGPEDKIDLLDHIMRELGISFAEERDMEQLLAQLRHIPEIEEWIQQKQIRLGMREVRAGKNRLASWYKSGWSEGDA